MVAAEVLSLVNGIVERKFEIFRHDLDLELMPIKIAIKTHEEQIGEIRANGIATANQLARIEGKNDAFIEEMRNNHAENKKANAELIGTLAHHVGEHVGADKQTAQAERTEGMESETRRQWVKIGLSLVGSGGLLKWLHDHWQKLHHPH